MAPQYLDRRAEFDAAGYAIFEELLPEPLVAQAAAEASRLFEHMPEQSGAELKVYGDPERGPELLSRIDHPHLVSRSIAELLRHPALGAAAAGLLRGEAVQAWYVHMSRKPPANGSRAHIGWHQDGQYSSFMDGSFVTAWIPLTDIGPDDSPICYVPGSQCVGIVGGSGFSGEVSPEELKNRLLARCTINWSETEVCARPGTVVIHDSLIIHGSRNNVGNRPRIALTVHMRSERNPIRGMIGYRLSMDRLHDPDASPILYGDRGRFADLAKNRESAC